jgi:hypothetical protein
MLLKLGISDSRIVDYLFLSSFNRYPSDEERQAILSDLHSNNGAAAKMTAYSSGEDNPKRQALEDLIWAILTSKEFMFNH